MTNGQLNKNLSAVLEAILFVYGEPLEIKRIAKLLKTDEATVKDAIKNLEQEYLTEGRGLKLIFSDPPAGGKIQLATKPDFAILLEDFIKEEFKETLTPAALETLSLIAYLGPVSRAQVDYYRGVNSSFIVRSLLIRGLIERKTDSKRANAYLYEPSFDLLKYLGISKVEDMPEYEKFKTINNKQEI